MPIHDDDKGRYPPNWDEITARIRERAGGRCECRGECGVDHSCHGPAAHQLGLLAERRRGQPVSPRGDASPRCDERQHTVGRDMRGRVVLTVAHLDHTPENCAPDNLRAMCQGCHNRYDQAHRQRNQRRRQREWLERRGQVELL